VIAVTIPHSVTIREGHILAVPETVEQTATRRRELAAITEPEEVRALRTRLLERTERARAARLLTPAPSRA
jgi:hypothetical protein